MHTILFIFEFFNKKRFKDKFEINIKTFHFLNQLFFKKIDPRFQCRKIYISNENNRFKWTKIFYFEFIEFFLSLIIQSEESKFSLNANIAYILSNELIDEILFMNNDIQSEKSKFSFNADIKFISSKSLIENVEFAKNDIRIEKNMILLETDISSKKFIENIKLKCDNN